MAKKKKSRRKQQRLIAQKKKQSVALPLQNNSQEKVIEPKPPTTVKSDSKPDKTKKIEHKTSIKDQINIDAKEHIYVKQDLTKIITLALCLLGLIVVTWIVLEKTSFGSSVYHIIKI